MRAGLRVSIIFFALFAISAFTAEAQASRLLHAKELLGKYYRRSVVRLSEKVPHPNQSIGKFVTQWTKKALPTHFKRYSRTVASTILKESRRHGFDPMFVMAVIEHESSFQPDTVGMAGEVGLMQVRLSTAEWLAQKYKIPFKGEWDLMDPVTNIRLGTAFLAWLRERFDSHSRLYLSAYNMGSTNVNRALSRQIWPKDYVSAVMQRYVHFYSELSKGRKIR